jgi:hypothetical protein
VEDTFPPPTTTLRVVDGGGKVLSTAKGRYPPPRRVALWATTTLRVVGWAAGTALGPGILFQHL